MLPSLTAPVAPDRRDDLSARELEILRLLSAGLTNKEIAERLMMSVNTVHSHDKSIFSKLDVTTRAAATRAALVRGLVDQLAVRLAELGLPLMLVCNMADEAAARGVRLDHRRLAEALGIPVLSTVATSGRGVGEVAAALAHPRPSSFALRYPEAVEAALERITPLFSGASVAPRGLALLWLTGDPAALETITLFITAAAAAARRGEVEPELCREAVAGGLHQAHQLALGGQVGDHRRLPLALSLVVGEAEVADRVRVALLRLLTRPGPSA